MWYLYSINGKDIGRIIVKQCIIDPHFVISLIKIIAYVQSQAKQFRLVS